VNPLELARKALAEVEASLRALENFVASENRATLTDDETAKATAFRAQRDQLDARIADLEADDRRRAAVDASAARAQQTEDAEGQRRTGSGYVQGKDLVYTRESQFERSYFRDLITATRQAGSPEGFDAQRRLNDHANMLANVPKQDIANDFRGGAHKRAAGEARANASRVDGSGGYFVPPLWLVDEFVPYLRAGRTVADRMTHFDLPGGTDSINLPKLSIGTAVGLQTDNGAVTSQDPTDAFVSSPVATVAGQVDIALQLLEQSPVSAGFDSVMAQDLASAYTQKIDQLAIYANGTSDILTGIFTTAIASGNTVTYSSGSPTLPEMYPYFGKAASLVARQRFQMIDAITMTPQRWYFLATQLDTANRPLVVPRGAPGFNSAGQLDLNAEGLVGEVLGTPIYIDANMPSTYATNQDYVLAAKFKDTYLFEGALRTRVLTEVLSGTLQVRVQLYNYAAMINNRFPKSLSAITGTGTVSPTGF
jgi:HK97 family phage major capsid protein